jgi:signal transduction histidine kinase
VDVTVDTGADGLLTVLVKDNGRGIRPGTRRSGLANMADRAVGLGGRLRIAPADGGGTQLEWQVPVPPEAPAGQVDGLAPSPGRYPLR